MQRPTLEDCLDNVREAILIFDHDWRYTYVNRAAAELAGKSTTELLGKTVWEVFPQLKGTLFYTELHRVAVDRQHRHFEEYCTSNGRWLDNTLYPTNDGLIAIILDITDQKRSVQAAQSKFGRRCCSSWLSPPVAPRSRVRSTGRQSRALFVRLALIGLAS
jgi:PAS domain S-box-containing protein